MSKPKQQLQLGKEYPREGEEAIIDEMVKQMEDQLDRLYTGKKMLRQIHPKTTAIVKAEFIVEPDLPEDLRVGLFKESTTYPAWLRFSNGKTIIQPDRKKDIRGVAIKVMNVPGKKLLETDNEAGNQDFIFLSAETFLARDLHQFSGTLKAATSPRKADLALYFLNPFHFKILRRTLKSFIICKHSFAIPYWSNIPFRYGGENTAVKFHIQPSENNVLEYTDMKNDNYLLANNAATLEKHDVYFDFLVQFQTDAVKMPVEDPTVPWTSPQIKVATIKIPKQTFNTPEQMEFGDNISFNIWHTLPEHRPLGSFGRARKRLYFELTKFRHERNHLPVFEPTASPGSQKTNTMDNPTNLQIIQQLYQYYAQHNIEGVMSLFDPNCVWVEPGAPDIPFAGTFAGHEGLGQMFAIQAKTIHVTSFVPKKFCISDDTVAVLGSDVVNVIPTGKTYTTEFVQAFTLANGKITNVMVYMDTNAIAKAFQP